MRVLLVDFNPSMPAVTPISLGYLAAALEARGHETRIVSLGATSRFSPASLGSMVREFSPHLVGLGTYQRNQIHVRGMARLAREVDPECRVVLGGPQAAFLPAPALEQMPEVDYLARGEGEPTILAIVEALACGAVDEPVPGTTSRLGDGTIVTGERVEWAHDLDAYPSPWLSGTLDPGTMDECILLTSRGCPHSCIFCITPTAFGRRIRFHSLERVLHEIEVVARKGNGRLWFADPDFCRKKERAAAILEGILERGLEVQMWMEARADSLTPELMELMVRAGVYRVALGLESASPNVFPGLKKRLEPERIEAAARALLARGIDVELFSQYALPGESTEDALGTLEFVQGCGVAIRGNTNAQQMQLYFGSEITASYERYGIRPLHPERPPHVSIGTDFETEWMSRDEIARVRAAWKAASADGGKRIVS